MRHQPILTALQQLIRKLVPWSCRPLWTQMLNAKVLGVNYLQKLQKVVKTTKTWTQLNVLAGTLSCCFHLQAEVKRLNKHQAHNRAIPLKSKLNEKARINLLSLPLVSFSRIMGRFSMMPKIDSTNKKMMAMIRLRTALRAFKDALILQCAKMRTSKSVCSSTNHHCKKWS